MVLWIRPFAERKAVICDTGVYHNHGKRWIIRLDCSYSFGNSPSLEMLIAEPALIREMSSLSLNPTSLFNGEFIMKIFGIPGSLRADSFNKSLLESLSNHVVRPDEMSVFQSMVDIPVFNEDLEESNSEMPEAVLRLWQKARDADVLIFATPEYNQAMSGATKNVIDWLSREPDRQALKGKTVAVIGASTGSWGARIAQNMTRSVLLSCGAKVASNATLYQANARKSQPSTEQLLTFIDAIKSAN
jgi:chromate reductase